MRRRRGPRGCFDRWSSRKVEVLHEEITRSPAGRPGWDATRVASYSLALCVHLCTLALLSGRKTDYWDDLRDALARLPDSERERRLRAAARQRLRVDQSHPPAHLRIDVLRGLPATDPALPLEPDEEQRIRAGLAADYALIARRLHDDAQERLHLG